MYFNSKLDQILGKRSEYEHRRDLIRNVKFNIAQPFLE